MVHLCVHLPREAILGGLVHSRWMYPVKRYLGHLKKYVRNKARPEGSSAEGYIVQEAMTFSSQYLRGIQSKFSMRQRDDDKLEYKRNYALEVFRPVGCPIRKNDYNYLSTDLLDKAKWFVFNNYPDVEPYLE